ncbi:MAG TPA: hypothetical protein VK071_05215 [Tissierellales bacterium]|nr:hypothetical protein [Tissierellales bacterium]
MNENYIDTILDPEIKNLQTKNEHICNQIQTFNDMIHNYKIELKENMEKLDKLQWIKETN